MNISDIRFFSNLEFYREKSLRLPTDKKIRYLRIGGYSSVQ